VSNARRADLAPGPYPDDMTGLDDTLDAFEAAADWVAALVHAIPDDAWQRPGLGDWDVRALVGHTSRALVTVCDYLGRPADEEAVSSPVGYYRRATTSQATPQGAAEADRVRQRGIQAGAALGDDPVASVDELAERAVALARAAGDPVIETIVGGIRFGNYLPTRTFELIVHGLDIAVAVGLPMSPPGDALRAAWLLAAELAAAGGKGAEALLALTGRRALPDGFSVLAG
jgi:uncharacterized protein (TIGR03083 family)